MPKIRFYDDSELEGLTEDQLAHLRLVSRVLALDDFAKADALKVERLIDAELREILGEHEPKPKPVIARPQKVRKPRESKKPARPIHITPRTLNEGFVLVGERLMRRRVAIVEVVRKDNTRYTRESEHLVPCGGRVRFNGRVYSAAVVSHYLRTGELVDRVPRAKPAPRFKAQIRVGRRVVHIGYFDTQEERDAAVFAYRLGIVPTGSK
jgi:hypothetical protein